MAIAPITRQMVASVQSRVAELRNLSFSEIQALPESETSELEMLGKRIRLSVYRASKSPDRTLVVAQAFRDRWFGISAEIRAAGFVISSTGEKSEASEEMLWDYE
jgi:hypothetical protein